MAVCMLFDKRGDFALRQLWSRLESHGVPSLLTHTHGNHHPHLSLAVLREWDLDKVRQTVASLPDGGPVTLDFHGLLAFPRGRVCIAPSVSAEVMVRQQALVESLAATGAELHRHYLPGAWIPHCSLSPRAGGSALPVVAKAVTDVLPLTVNVTHGALIDSSTGQTWPLETLP